MKLTNPRKDGDLVECMCCHNFSDWFDMNGAYCDDKNDFPVCDGCSQSSPIIEKDENGANVFKGYRNNKGFAGACTPEARLKIVMNKKHFWEFWK